MNYLQYRQLIQDYQKIIEHIERHIIDITKEAISDYHFLDYKISKFWECNKSPIGMCVFKLDEMGKVKDCRYCGQPEERK